MNVRGCASAVLVLLAVAVGCARPAGDTPGPAAGGPREVTRSPGRKMQPAAPEVPRALPIGREAAVNKAREALAAWPVLANPEYPEVDFSKPVTVDLHGNRYHVAFAGRALYKNVNKFYVVAVVDGETGAILDTFINAI
jgi:hypothetical protein